MEIGGLRAGDEGRSGPPRRYDDAILQLVEARSRPVTALAIFTALARQPRRPGLATVYRALHALTAADALHAIDAGGEVAYRRCGSQPHDHLVCEHCGFVAEVPRTSSRAWFRLGRDPGFLPPAHPVQLLGVCDACSR